MKKKAIDRKIGVIDPNKLYSSAGLHKVGIGRHILRTERHENGLPYYCFCNQNWYVGQDVINLILSKGNKNTKSN